MKSSRTGVLVNGAQTTTVNVGAGSSGATFTVSATTSPTEPDYVTLTASGNGWTQSSLLTVLPTGYSLTVGDLTVLPGNGCAMLNWKEVEGYAITGYHIDRRLGMTTTRLTSSPILTSTYADSGLTNSTAYEYRVSLVDLQGQEISTSAWVSVTPSATIPTMSDLVGEFRRERSS